MTELTTREVLNLMDPHVPLPRYVKAKWPLNTKPPRWSCCGNEPPECRCEHPTP